MVTRIVVIGMGYVGIPIAALLADVDGFDVTGLQRRSKRSGWKIEKLNAGESPFEINEPGLGELLSRIVKKGTFRVTDDKEVLRTTDTILVDVQTPTDKSHVPQYESLREVSADIGERMKKGAMVIVESTVAPGTTENLVKPILEHESGYKCGSDFDLVFSYERVMPGKLIENIVNLPRVVGGMTPKAAERAREMYSKIVKAPLRTTTALTAELAKTVENAYRDVNIAFANEMALVCESLGVDVYEVRALVNELDSRHMHIPGAGVGGHCLPKDTWLLRYGVREYGSTRVEPEFISLARRINNHMPIHMAELVENALETRGRQIRESIVTILGAAYLEDSDDTRNTPAATLLSALTKKGATVRLHDPYVRDWEFSKHEIMRDLVEAATGSDCLVLVTKHRMYSTLDLDLLKKVMRTPSIVDGRNALDRKVIEEMGFEYRCIGKGGIRPNKR
ncbi:MAG: nucleotide sugar dehydrogenase [Candidatus Thorarchaeota archaeon]|nr:MAG: nucleotide sugar dehydrogenase [Candidatus Thorarchaeota archaeon]